MITSVTGVRLGHWTDPVARTGCTVALLPAGTVASGEIRGGAPGTREWALLDPRRTVDRINAVVLAGGSAFGLAACDGVVSWCEERGIGWPTSSGPVPIVVGLVVYDLGVGDPKVRPGAEAGYSACVSAVGGGQAEGRGPIGAGCGATVGNWRGPGHARPGGLGSSVLRHGELVVACLAVVNAVGDLRGGADDALRLIEQPTEVGGSRPPTELRGANGVTAGEGGGFGAGEATTLALVVTNATLTKAECRQAAESGHDGLARALDPVHTFADGDAVLVAATREVQAPPATVRTLAAATVEAAIVDALAGDAGAAGR